MKKNNIRYQKKILRFVENHRKQLVGSVATVGLTGFITLTSFLSFGCTQEEIDADNELINQLSTEQAVDKPETEIVTEPEVIEPDVEPVEEVNPRDYKAVYGLDFDIPVYTEEEVEQARINLDTKYENPVYWDDGIGNEFISFEDNPGYVQDYYIVNQDLIYAFYNAAKDIDWTKVKRSGCYYDEEYGVLYELDKHTDKLGSITVFFKDSDYQQYLLTIEKESDYDKSFNIMDCYPQQNVNDVKVGPASWISKTIYTDDKWIEILINNRGTIKQEDLEEIGFKYDEYTEFVAKHRDEVQKLQYK